MDYARGRRESTKKTELEKTSGAPPPNHFTPHFSEPRCPSFFRLFTTATFCPLRFISLPFPLRPQFATPASSSQFPGLFRQPPARPTLPLLLLLVRRPECVVVTTGKFPDAGMACVSRNCVKGRFFSKRPEGRSFEKKACQDSRRTTKESQKHHG